VFSPGQALAIIAFARAKRPCSALRALRQWHFENAIQDALITPANKACYIFGLIEFETSTIFINIGLNLIDVDVRKRCVRHEGTDVLI
jgi:hypothetical protein